MSENKRCPNCGRTIVGHPNKRFCGSTCKDRHHNRTNPRGYGARPERDEYMATIHPFSDEAFGQ
jgi:hypothetical protein